MLSHPLHSSKSKQETFIQRGGSYPAYLHSVCGFLHFFPEGISFGTWWLQVAGQTWRFGGLLPPCGKQGRKREAWSRNKVRNELNTWWQVSPKKLLARPQCCPVFKARGRNVSSGVGGSNPCSTGTNPPQFYLQKNKEYYFLPLSWRRISKNLANLWIIFNYRGNIWL